LEYGGGIPTSQISKNVLFYANLEKDMKPEKAYFTSGCILERMVFEDPERCRRSP
jgi:hypothetical protein